MPKLIFVIGPARSGTHLVASSIVKALPQAQYLPEINEFWSRYTLRTQDSADPKYYSAAYLNKIRNDYFELADGAEFIVEKTAANSLRIDFIRALFPSAQFVFVQRNCFQVIKSVLKKQKGNISKVSNSPKATMLPRFKMLFKRASAKFSIVEKNPVSLFKLVKANIANVFNILNLKSDLYWGPKFCSKKSRTKIRHPELYAFLQWAACATEIENSKHDNYKSSLFLKFDEVVNDPLSSAKSLNEFLHCSGIVFDIDARVDMVVNEDDFEFYDLIKRLSSRLGGEQCL